MYKLAQLLFLLAIATPAQAAAILDVVQQGSDVVATVSGTLDITGLRRLSQGTPSDGVGGIGHGFSSLITGGNTAAYNYLATGPESFMSNSSVAVTTGSGMKFGISIGPGTAVFVDSSYVSGASLFSSATWSNQTLAELGLTQGQYVYSVGSDQLTINVGSVSAVPEPAAWSMLIAGFGLIGVAMRRRQSASQKARAVA